MLPAGAYFKNNFNQNIMKEFQGQFDFPLTYTDGFDKKRDGGKLNVRYIASQHHMSRDKTTVEIESVTNEDDGYDLTDLLKTDQFLSTFQDIEEMAQGIAEDAFLEMALNAA